MAINTEAFIQSAAMQMKAQSAPGERQKTREPTELSGGAGESAGYIQTSAPSISTAAIRFLILLVLREARLSCHNEADSAPVAPFFLFTVVSQGPLGFLQTILPGCGPYLKD